MSAIAVSQNGNHIFLALENESGFPVIVKTTRADLSTFTVAYNPAAGTAANVVAAGEDTMLFYGNFGSGVQVIKHTVSSGANANISPTGLTTKVANCLAVNPSDTNEIWLTVNTDQDLLRTLDQGATWETLNAALGFSATAMLVFWEGEYELDRGYIAGNVSGTEELLYTVDEGDSYGDYAGAALGAVADVVGLDGVEP